MYENSVFNVDLTGCFTSSEIITNVSLALELPNAKEKKINLKFNDMVLNQSQLLSIKSLISSYGSELNVIETSSREMKAVCEGLEIKCLYFGPNGEIEEYQAPKVEEKTEEVKEEPTVVEVKEEIIETPAVEEIKEEVKETTHYDFSSQNYHPIEEKQEEVKEDFYKAPEFTAPLEEEMPEVNNALPEDIDVEGTIMRSAMLGLENAKENQTENKTLDYIYQTNTIEEKQEEVEEAEEIEEDEDDEEEMKAYTKAPSEHEGEEYNFYEAPTNEPIVATSTQTIYVTQTLRSGQVLEYNGHIVIIGDCHPGAEIKATGDITVWGVLGCVAHAGIKGDKSAKIRALKMNAVQLRIADVYSRRPDGSNLPYIIRSAEFTPEEARLTEDGIVLYKMN